MNKIENAAAENLQTTETKEEKVMSNNELIKSLSIAASSATLLGIVIVQGGKCIRCHNVESTKLKMCKDNNAARLSIEGQKTLRQENRIALVSSAIKFLVSSAISLQ
jgi:hypothetical protein